MEGRGGGSCSSYVSTIGIVAKLWCVCETRLYLLHQKDVAPLFFTPFMVDLGS